MIVVSGALAVIAFVLLIAGLISSGLTLVYASIAVSAVAFVFLGVGAYQRRGEEVARTGEAAIPAPAAVGGGEELTRVIPVAGAATTPTFAEADPVDEPAVVDEEPAYAPAAAADDADEEYDGFAEDTAGEEVLVVAGRPRYHVAGCRYLAGKDTESRSRTEAIEEGFSACGVCKPDEALAAAPLASVSELPTAPEPEPAEADEEEEEVAPVAARPGTRRTAATTVPAKKTATKTAAKKTAAKKTAAKTAAATGATKAAASTSRGKVVVIPDRGKYHKADCRFVRDADATLELTKAAATKQGYAACGVCKP